MNSDLDEGIASNLNAALIQNKLHDSVMYSVKNRAVTLTGEVESQSKRSQAADVASSVPNVQQVVNELQVKKQKAPRRGEKSGEIRADMATLLIVVILVLLFGGGGWGYSRFRR